VNDIERWKEGSMTTWAEAVDEVMDRLGFARSLEAPLLSEGWTDKELRMGFRVLKCEPSPGDPRRLDLEIELLPVPKGFKVDLEFQV